jgi:hypothetical protein
MDILSDKGSLGVAHVVMAISTIHNLFKNMQILLVE